MTSKSAKRFSVDIMLQVIGFDHDNDFGWAHLKSSRSLRRAYNMGSPVRSKKMAVFEPSGPALRRLDIRSGK
jgi:hypothetical protein